jgi:ABC-type uncharacterized transport system involved in gliding motility auxiliary subunit
VFLLLNPRADAGLNSLLDDWGVILDDRLVLDTSGAGQFVGLGPAAPIVSDYGDHPITQEFGTGRTFFPLARPVESRELPNISSTPLLLTHAQSQPESIPDEGDLSYDPNAPPEGPYVLGVALSRPAEAATAAIPEAAERTAASDSPTPEAATDTVAEPEPNGGADSAATPEAEPEPSAVTETVEPVEETDATAEANGAADSAATVEAEVDAADAGTAAPAEQTDTESRLVVIGNSGFATDGAFNQQLNGDLFLNAVNWLGQQADATLSIGPKTVTDRRLQMTGQQAWGLGIFSILVLPLTGLALAILMALRRR